MGRLVGRYEALKLEVRGKVAALSSEERDARLEFLLSEFDRHSTTGDEDDYLRAVVYAIAVMLHLEKHGGLHRRDISRFVDVADRLIKLLSLDGHEAAAITAEYHLAASQLKRRLGDNEGAFWQLCCIDSAKAAVPVATRRRIALSLANRYLRLGHVVRARAHFEFVVQHEEDTKPLLQAMTSLIHCCRLTGSGKEFARAVALYQTRLREVPAFALELNWEELCFAAQTTGNLTRMVRAASASGEFKAADYALEANLWAAAVPEKRWLDKSTKATSVAQTRRADLRRLAPLLATTKAIESLYDPELPRHAAQDVAFEILSTLCNLPTLDKELLALAALVRWLHRSRARELFQFCVLEYKARCARFAVLDRDPLGLISDLYAFAGG